MLNLEVGLCQMAKEMMQANQLDLSTDAAKFIKRAIDEIQCKYNEDFPAAPVEPAAFITHMSTSPGGDRSELRVLIDEAPLTEQEYKAHLEEYNTKLALFQDRTLDAYITGKVVLLLDDLTNLDLLREKIHKCGFMGEDKKKAFVHDAMCSRPTDPERLPKRHKSIFTRLKQNMTPDQLNVLMTLWSHFRNKDSDGLSDDMIIAVVPGAPPNSPQNKNVMVVYQVFSKVFPKLQAPKIGQIEAPHQDVMMRVRSGLAFEGGWVNDLVSQQRKKEHSHGSY